MNHPRSNITPRFISLAVIRGMVSTVAAWVFAFLGGWLSAQQNVAEIQTLAGKTTQGALLSFDNDSLTMTTGDGTSSFNFDQIKGIRFGNASAATIESPVRVTLVDGSVLNATSFSIQTGKVQVNLNGDLVVTVDSRNVESIRLRNYEHDLELERQWKQIQSESDRQGDAIVVNRSGELDTIEGIVGDFADEKLTFSIEDRTARVALAKLDAILFYHATGRELAAPVAEVQLIDQSLIRIRRFEMQGGNLVLTTVCGEDFSLTTDSVLQIRFSLGRSILLSDLPPTTNDWQPLLTSSAILAKLRRLRLARTNESFSGRPLSLKITPNPEMSFLSTEKKFENGFAMHSGGKLAFALEQQYEQLTGMVGFDPAANPNGNVLFKVIVDGNVVLEKELVNKMMKNPLELNLNIGDADRIVFQVDYLDGRSTGDQIHLVDLKVSQ